MTRCHRERVVLVFAADFGGFGWFCAELVTLEELADFVLSAGPFAFGGYFAAGDGGEWVRELVVLCQFEVGWDGAADGAAFELRCEWLYVSLWSSREMGGLGAQHVTHVERREPAAEPQELQRRRGI